MSVSLREVIEAGGYDLTAKDDIIWLLSKQDEFNDLIEEAEDRLEQIEEEEENDTSRWLLRLCKRPENAGAKNNNRSGD